MKNRLGWNALWMCIAHMLAMRATCEKARVGCVIVKDNKLIASGYNGTPAGSHECLGAASCTNNFSHKCDKTIHAEQNALMFADRDDVLGSTLYCTHSPCLTCAKMIANSGIKRVIFDEVFDQGAVEWLSEYVSVFSAEAVIDPAQLFLVRNMAKMGQTLADLEDVDE